MNINMNLNSIMSGQLNLVKENSSISGAKGKAFFNMFNNLKAGDASKVAVILNSNENQDASIMNLSMLEMIFGSDSKGILTQGEEINEIDVLLNSGKLNKEEIMDTKEITDTKEINEDIIGLLSEINYTTAAVPEFNTDITKGVQITDSAKYINELINQTKYTGNEQKQSWKNNVKLSLKEVQPQEVIAVENSDTLSTYSEKLISQIESSRNKLKNEINYHAEIALSNKTIISDNKVIEVSDASNEIRSSILSQVKDKVVLMINEGANGTKNVTMELNPENMGKVHIKMTYNNNQLSVEIKALNKETQKILFSNSGELLRVLNKSVDSNVNILVKHHESMYEQNPLDYNQNSGQGRQRNNYEYHGEKQDEKEDEDMFSQIMNLGTTNS